MKPKPGHLGAEYGAQWQDRAMANAYRHRPPYPPLIFKILKREAKPGPVLEIGAGTGDATLELAWLFDRVDAVEPSAEMLRLAARRTGRNIRWIHSTFEEAELEGPYGLAVAGESIHWTDWEVAFPKIADVLDPRGVLALLERELVAPPWNAELKPLLQRYSTNRDFEPYNLIEELRARKLYRVTGALSTLRERRLQEVDDYIESFHSRNGFSRERMGNAAAQAFDENVRAIVQPHLKEGLVPLTAYTKAWWGYPMP